MTIQVSLCLYRAFKSDIFVIVVVMILKTASIQVLKCSLSQTAADITVKEQKHDNNDKQYKTNAYNTNNNPISLRYRIPDLLVTNSLQEHPQPLPNNINMKDNIHRK